MNFYSVTCNCFPAKPFYHSNVDGKTANVYQFPKPYVAIATDSSNFTELATSRLQECTKSNRIKLCCKGFSTTMDEALLCLKSLYFNQNIPALHACPISSVFSQKPHKRSTWQMGSTTSSLATPQWISKMTTEHVDSVYYLLTVKHVSSDIVLMVPFTLIKAIWSCLPTCTHVKRLRKHISQQSNSYPPLNQVFQIVRFD